MKSILKICFAFTLMLFCFQFASAKTAEADGVIISYTEREDGTIQITAAQNKTANQVAIYIDGGIKDITLNAHSSTQSDVIAKKNVIADFKKSGSRTLWSRKTAKPTINTEAAPEPVANQPQGSVQPTVTTPAKPERSEDKRDGKRDDRRDRSRDDHAAQEIPAAEIAPIPANSGYPAAFDILNADSFFGHDAVANFVSETDSFTENLAKADNKEKYVVDNNLEDYLRSTEVTLNVNRGQIEAKAAEIATAAGFTDDASRPAIEQSITEMLKNRLAQRELSFNKLKDGVNNAISNKKEKGSGAKVINFIILGVVVLGLGIWGFLRFKKRKDSSVAQARKAAAATASRPTSDNPDDSGIVVRRKTTAALKKQSLEDVIDNPAYLVIEASDFVSDSAVTRIYVKNTCIKDVYNMYAEDLRNTDNPKEDGCMVLGRWVLNEADGTYQVSMEEVVYPGDDAVFKEYELNFGGKIKMRVAEKLRKLRRDTGLQYDLVCWIHSHPGLGVFFSNSDDTVQTQLKDPRNPNFLVAFVIDILTSDQETGIFTFRRDGIMNSKNDLKKMYSLEEMYKWALDSDTATFTRENHFNLLGTAKEHMVVCSGVEVDNSSVIDITQIVVTPGEGIAGWAVGTSVGTETGREFVISKVMTGEKPGAGAIGVLVKVTHMSVPTIQRLISQQADGIGFVIVYSSRQGTVTTIPVIDGDVVADERYYGDETIDDLKIWTRRKR